MATTFTGLRVQDTYNAILKIGDNSNLTGTAKILSDGFGNSSAIYLSTTSIGIGVTPSYQLHTSSHAKIGGNLIISGNLTVNGTLTYLNVEDLAVEDPLIKLAKDNTANTLDIGFFGKYVATGTRYKGLFNDASDDKFKLFLGTTIEPGTTVNTSGNGYTIGTLVANLEGNVTGNLTGNVTGGTISGTTGAFSSTLDVDGNAAFDASILHYKNSTLVTKFFGETGSGYNASKLEFYKNTDLQIRLNGVDGSITAGGNLAVGGTGAFTGNLTGSTASFSGLVTGIAPTADLNFATKKYVDDNIPTVTTPTLSAVLAVGNTSGANNLIIQDNAELILGSSSDFRAFHNETNTLFRINTGDLIFNSFVTDGDIKFQLDNGAGSLTEYLRLDGGTENIIFSKPILAQSNITISNASPTLNLTDTDNSSNIAFTSVGGALVVNSPSDQVYQIGGTEKFRISTSTSSFAGNVGVGIAPDSNRQLKVLSRIAVVVSGTTANSAILFGDDDDDSVGQVRYNNSDDSMELRTDSTAFLTADSNQNSVFAGNITGSNITASVRLFSGDGGNKTNPMIANGSDQDTGIFFPAADKMAFTAGDTQSLILDGANASFSGSLSISGQTTFSDHSNWGDQVHARWGASQDLQIYHDGTNSYIKNNTGWLNMPMSGNGISIANSDFSKSIARFLVDGANELYYNGSKKLETTNTGVSFTGDLNVNGIAKFSGANAIVDVGSPTGCAVVGRNHAYDTLELKGYGAEFMIGAQSTTININYRTCNNNVSGHTPTDWFWRAGSATSFSNHNMGQVIAATDMRSPIFYDKDNTNYFVNPSGNTSARLYGFVKIGNSVDFTTDDGSWGTRLVVASTIHARIDVAQDVNDVRASWWAHTGNLYSQFGTVTNHAMYLMSYNSVRQKIENGFSKEEGSYRAPVFYDSNDTTFLIDANGTSVLYKLRIGGSANGFFSGGNNNRNLYYTGGSDGTDAGISGFSSNGSHLWQLYGAGNDYGFLNANWNSWDLRKTKNGNLYMNNNNSFYLNSSSISILNDTRSNIYYDASDTAYYLDPASSSNLLALIVQDNLFMNGGQFYIGAANGTTDNSYRMYKSSGELLIQSRESGTWTSRLVITDLGSVIPQGRFQIQARNDNTNVGTINQTNNQDNFQNLTNSSGQFTVTQYNNIAASNFTNEPTGVYTYGSVISTRTANHSFQLYSSHTGDLAYKTQWNNDNYSGWLTPVVYGRNAGNAGANYNIYGSAFYDRDNTTYYVDPNSTSIISSVRIGGTNYGLLSGGNTVQNLYYRGGGSSSDAGISGFAGNGSHVWQLYGSGNDYGFLDANWNAWDIRKTKGGNMFLNNQSTYYLNPSSTSFFNDLESIQMSSGIYYDRNNTSYFLDPQNKSLLYSIKFDGFLSGTSTGCSEIGRNHAYYTQELKGYGAEFMIGAQSTQININYRTCNNGASGHTPTDWFWRAGSASSFANMFMGQMSSSTNARAPIFYDSQNTGQFVDPGGSTSRILGFVKIGNSSTYNTDDGGWGTRLQVASNIHARIDVAQDANAMRSTWYCHTGLSYSFFGTTTAHDQWLYSRSTLRQKLANGFSEEMSSYRAPIFYDSNDTTYRIDGASTSQLNTLDVAGTLTVTSAAGIIATKFTDYGNGAYYLDPSSSSTSLNVAGKGVFAGDVVAFSDKKLKTNIKTLDGTKVLKMRGVSFNKINNNQKGSGVIAQEIQEIAPELITETNGTLGVAYGNLTGYLIEAIKNQQKTINDLNKRITDLENN